MREIKFDPAKFKQGRDYVLADGPPLLNPPTGTASTQLDRWLDVISRVKGRSTQPL